MKDLSQLEKNLRFSFKNKDILAQALVHRSFLNEDQKYKFSNERLEFLGDSVLSLSTSTHIFNLFPAFPEGKLTSTRSILVQAKTLARISQELGIGDYLLMSKGEELSGGRNNTSLLADSFEAIIGAIYLDSGFDAATKFIKIQLLDKMDELVSSDDVVDYKSLLQEKIQNTLRLSPSYQVRKTEGPDHAKTFYVEVIANDKSLGLGQGKSKQTAEQMAAKDALEKLG